MSLDLESWLRQARAPKSRAEILRLVDQFRPLEWTDEQRAAMARVYVRALSKLPPEDAMASAPAPKVKLHSSVAKPEHSCTADGEEPSAVQRVDARSEAGTQRAERLDWYEKM